MDNKIKHYVSDQGHHLTEFPMEFQDGLVKPSFLLTSLEKFTSNEFIPHTLDQYGLKSGIDFFTVNTTDLPDGVPVTNKLGNINGKRTILSLEGMLKLVTRERTEFGDRVCDWLYGVVVPKTLRDYPNLKDHSTLLELRGEVNRMGQEIRDQSQELGLTEAVVSIQINKKAVAVIGVVIAGAVVAYILWKRNKNKTRLSLVPDAVIEIDEVDEENRTS